MNDRRKLPFPRDARPTRALRATICLFVCALVTGWVAVCAATNDDNWRDYSKWEVTDFTVMGAPEAIAKDLKQGLVYSGKWKLLKGWDRPVFSARTLAEDLARIRLFLATHGYPAAQVVPTAVPNSVSRKLAIVITISVGESIRIGSVAYEGWPEGLARPDTTDSDIVAVGDIFVDEHLELSDAAVSAYLMDSGYALAEIRREIQAEGPGLVTVEYWIEAGDFYVIDEVTVIGCSEDLIGLVLRVVNISPGIDYSQEVVHNAALDLRLTQLFRVVEIDAEAISPGRLRLVINAENGTMRVWDAAVGTWSDNPWAVRTSWIHRNFFERGRGLDLRAGFATHEMDVGVGVNWLGWLSPRARTRAGAALIIEREDAYDSKEFRAELVQSYRPRTRNILNLGTAISENKIEELFTSDTDIPNAQGRLWEFWVDRKWEFTDEPMYPTTGGFIKVSVTFAEPWLISQVPYFSASVDLAHYLDLPGPLVFTSRLRAGAAEPLTSDSEVLANRRYYAGGYNSHRGYSRRGLGPTDLEGNSLGGEVVGLLSGELRFPLISIMEGGLFVDTGNIWETISVTSLENYPVAVGATIGFRTPLGPLRVGYAVNIADLVPSRSKNLWHFGIGYPW